MRSGVVIQSTGRPRDDQACGSRNAGAPRPRGVITDEHLHSLRSPPRMLGHSAGIPPAPRFVRLVGPPATRPPPPGARGGAPRQLLDPIRPRDAIARKVRSTVNRTRIYSPRYPSLGHQHVQDLTLMSNPRSPAPSPRLVGVDANFTPPAYPARPLNLGLTTTAEPTPRRPRRLTGRSTPPRQHRNTVRSEKILRLTPVEIHSVS